MIVFYANFEPACYQVAFNAYGFGSIDGDVLVR